MNWFVINPLIQRPAPSWLVSLVAGIALHRYCSGQGFESRTSLNFFSLSFRVLFATAKVASITAILIFIHIILHPAVHIYDFHIFITSSSFHELITNQFNYLLPAGSFKRA